jgi:hypothetical protein
MFLQAFIKYILSTFRQRVRPNVNLQKMLRMQRIIKIFSEFLKNCKEHNLQNEEKLYQDFFRFIEESLRIVDVY